MSLSRILGLGLAMLLPSGPIAIAPVTLATSQPVAPAVQPATLTLRLEISLSRRQLTVYQGKIPIKRYPVAIGRAGWETPVGQHQVKQMIRDPAWKNPFTGIVIPGGDPENPLGRYWIGFWTDGKNWIGMHGTPTPKSVGRAASHGCVRMFNKDIADVFQQVIPGTPITVVR
jgi:lipoprotein-anchoring transpeptidase ErfK/SrfK